VILAVDVGTSALKAVLYDRAGEVTAQASRRYGYTTPQPGWAEADPEMWWEAFDAAVLELAQRAELAAVQVIAFTGQMHTAVLLDAAGAVIPPTILWLDRRAVAETAELQQRLGMAPYHLNSTYTLPKLLWLARHQPEALAQCATLLWPKDYLRFRLTGVRCTDVTEAGGAALLNWETLTWATDRLASCGIDPALLPPLLPAQEDAGAVLAPLAARYGFAPDVKVIVGAGDVLALITGASPQPGRVTCSMGSSSMVFAPLAVGQTVAGAGQRLYIYPLLPYPLLGGVSSTTGAALHWAWQMLYEDQTPFDAALQQALATPAGAEGVLFLPFLSGERTPFWNDALRGAFYGLTLTHRRSHLLRAVLEGVAFSLRYLLDEFARLNVAIDAIALAGGGAAITGLPQLVADVCARPVAVYAGEETVTRALYAYACQVRDGEDFASALSRTFGAAEVFAPSHTLARHYDEIYAQYCQLAEFANATLAQNSTEPRP
jgi:xylulokinase